MNVLLISECDKRALRESRRILDQFAERHGERTWQTAITEAGLDTLRRMLRKTARKNTAVACHWIRGRDHSELLWIVGDASRFNAEGAVPTNTTSRNVLKREDENDWHTGEDIRLLSGLAALLHDLGKAMNAFQDMLKSSIPTRNLYRHEWVSLRLFQAFVGTSSDEEWLQRLISPEADDDASWLGRLQRDGIDSQVDAPLAKLPPLARAIGWLVVTHHRLPQLTQQYKEGFRSERIADLLGLINADWNDEVGAREEAGIPAYWRFDRGPLPVFSKPWRARAARIAKRLLALLQKRRDVAWLDSPYIMHVSRLSLMLADHHYSSLGEANERTEGEKNYPLYANTKHGELNQPRELNQPLDEHLIGVEQHSQTIVRALPGFERHLPRLARHKRLTRRSESEGFRWQDKATDTVTALRQQARAHGAFLINMASTGCGKTLANARMMNAVSEPDLGMRCAFAMGLRTLTLQTGQAFRELLNLSDDELAIRVGGGASRALFEHYEAEAKHSGSESSQSLIEKDGVLFEGSVDHPLLSRAMKNPDVKRLLAAPILVCTVDHLVPATEGTRGGQQIAPMLRLMSSDLVLDELDDFDLNDLPALTRLMYWTGLLGSRVLISSATLPPSLVGGMYRAYLEGRKHYQRNRGEHPGKAPEVCCVWVDEFSQQASQHTDADHFDAAHLKFAEKRRTKLAAAAVRRSANLLELNFETHNTAERRQQLAARMLSEAAKQHAAHASTDPHSGKRISFGLIRMANIAPLYDVARAMFKRGAPAGLRVHLCVYHSRFPLLLRSAIERRLDSTLKRKEPTAVFDLPDIRTRIDQCPEQDQLFIVLGSPVTEVGRDHDYDWAIVEPSSMRSLIQLAGRVRRHRPEAYAAPNIALFNFNLRHFEHSNEAAYCKPGFENSEPWRLKSHDLLHLLNESERSVIDARPRIVARPESEWRPHDSLVDLEHARLKAQMLPGTRAPTDARSSNRGRKPQPAPLNACSIWTSPLLHLSAVLQQKQPFRLDTQDELDAVLLPDEDGESWQLRELVDAQRGRKDETPIQLLCHAVPATEVHGERIVAWGASDYLTELSALADEMDLPLQDCARRFGTVTLPVSKQGWWFHPALGFTKHD